MNRGFPSGILIWALAVPLAPMAASDGHAQAVEKDLGSAPLKDLEAAARKGDKAAALELGIRYENGSGVSRDERKAVGYYRQAARTEIRRITVYSPPVGSERYGRVVQAGPSQTVPGLPEAARRLTNLLRRGK